MLLSSWKAGLAAEQHAIVAPLHSGRELLAIGIADHGAALHLADAAHGRRADAQRAESWCAVVHRHAGAAAGAGPSGVGDRCGAAEAIGGHGTGAAQVKGGTAVATAAHRPLIDRGQAAIVGIAAAGAAGQREVIGDAAGRADADGAELGLSVRNGDANAAGRTVDIAIIGRDQHRPQLAHSGVGGGHAGASVGDDAAIDAPLIAVGDGIAIGIAGAAGADRQIIGGQRGIR